MAIIVAVLALVVFYQHITIHRLYDRLLSKAGVVPLGTVIRQEPAPEKPARFEGKKKLFSVNMGE